MYLIIILLMLSMGGNVFGQAPDTLWTRTYGGVGDDEGVAVLALGNGAIMCGWKETEPYRSGWLIRVGTNGDTLWTKEMETGSWARINGICQLSDGGFAVAGFNDGLQSAFVARCNSLGDTLWTRRISTQSETIFDDIICALNGDLIAIGHGYGGMSRVLVSRISSQGNLIWTRSYGVWPVIGNAIVELPNQTLLAVTEGTMNVISISSTGDSLWSRSYYSWLPYDVAAEGAGNVMICGAAGASGFFLAKMNANGDTLWTRKYLEYRNAARSFAVERTVDGGYFLGGYSRILGGNAFRATVLKVNADGDSSWCIDYFGQDDIQCLGIDQDPLGRFYAVGYANMPPIRKSNLWAASIDQEIMQVTYPIGTEQAPIFSTDTIRWAGVGFDGGVSIELNRHYPIGAWETITDSTENDGAYEWFVTDPLSDSCRIRICALQDTFCDVSDGNFSIVSSQGYLALVRSSQANTPLTSWNFGAVECPNAASQWFRFKNFGSESIVVFQPLEPESSEFSRNTPCGAFFALATNQMSACSVRVVFDPASDGIYSDVLRVQTDAVNGVNGFVEFALAGEQISTPAAPEVVITTAGLDAHLSWSVVDTSIGGCAVSGLWYAVFYSPTSGGPFYYHGWTPQTMYTHSGVVNFSPTQFYQVVAVEGPTSLAESLEKGMLMSEALGKIRNEKFEMGKAER